MPGAFQTWREVRESLKGRMASLGYYVLDDFVNPAELSAGQLSKERLSLIELVGKEIKVASYNRKLLNVWHFNIHVVGDLMTGDIGSQRLDFIEGADTLALAINQPKWWQGEATFQRLLVTSVEYLEGNFTNANLDPTIIIAVLSLELDTIQTLEDLGG